MLEGREPEDAEEVRLPPVPLEDVERLVKAAGRSSIRECTVTHIRHVLPRQSSESRPDVVRDMARSLEICSIAANPGVDAFHMAGCSTYA